MRYHLKYVLLIIIPCLFVACKSEKTEQAPDKYQVFQPIVKDASYKNEYVSEIQSVNYVEIRTLVRGYLENIYVDEGQMVNEGQVLFSINSLEFEKELQKNIATLKNSQAELKVAEVELMNIKTLTEKNVVAKAELEMARAKVEALRAKVEESIANKEQAELKVSFSKIKAPFTGIINRIPKKVGSLLEEGDALTSISDNREVFAYFNLPESDYLSYVLNGNDEQAKNVSLMLANSSLYKHQGKIETIESEFDPSTGNIAFRARFPNPDGLLKHGANGKIVLTKNLEDALLVPQKSTFEIQDKIYVFVVGKDNIVKQRNLVAKMRIPHFYVVESGLEKDERILYEGIQNVKDGDKIQAQIIPQEQVMLAYK